MPEIEAMAAARAIITGRRLVSKKAVAAGVTSMATIRATPTVWSETTMATAIRMISRKSKRFDGSLSVLARMGSKDRTRNSL